MRVRDTIAEGSRRVNGEGPGEWAPRRVRDGKGAKDRVTMLPSSLVQPLRAHLVLVHELHDQDLAAGVPGVYLPYALDRKYPNAPREWAWQYVFPSDRLSTDQRSGLQRRHHLDEQNIQRAMRQALRDAGVAKPATPHTLRHSFATHLLESGHDIPPLEICVPNLCASTMFTF